MAQTAKTLPEMWDTWVPSLSWNDPLEKRIATHSRILFWRFPGTEKPARLLCPWDIPGKNTGVHCHFLLQGIFPNQGLNSRLLHWQAGSLPLGHQGNPCIGCLSTNGHYSGTVIRKQHRISIFPITCMQSFSPRLALSGGPTGNSAQCYVAV